MPAKEMTLITERKEERLFTDTNENWTLKRIKQGQKLCMTKNCWQHDEMVTYRILEDYTDDVYQLSLSSRKGGLYVERIQKRQDLKNKAFYCWQEDTTFATLTREKIEKSMWDTDHFNAMQEPCQLPEKEINHQYIIRRSEKQRPMPYVVEKVECSQNWLVLKLVRLYFMLLLCYVCLSYVDKKVTILRIGKNTGGKSGN